MILIFSILWVAANLFMLAVANSSEQNIARGLNDIMQELDPLTHFQSSPKNIMFGANMGASSHHSWVMRVLDELDRRGHKITYATTVSARRVQWYKKMMLTAISPTIEKEPSFQSAAFPYQRNLHWRYFYCSKSLNVPYHDTHAF